eukprot:TRINITY_DN4071_c0_g4_i1.p1 TRINITY_DN4071_c0_g4~~TRINITY_DN4071_c0_g4_i1.p1  ORF type:complete len:799 (-),score=182.40 TRINITY_DN4071_c0_g4_i1:122-2470(-)
MCIRDRYMGVVLPTVLNFRMKPKKAATDLAFRQTLLAALSKLNDAATVKTGLDEVATLIQAHVDDTERLGLVIHALGESNEHQRPLARRESFKIFGMLAASRSKDLTNLLPRLLATFVKRVKDDAGENLTAIGEAFGSVVEHGLRDLAPTEGLQLFAYIEGYLTGVITKEPNKNVQAGCAVCLTRLIQTSPLDVLIFGLDETVARLLEIARNPNFKAQAHLLEALLSLLLAVEEKLADRALEFLPMLIDSSTCADWNVRKLCCDVVYSLAVLPKVLRPHRADLLSLLNACRTDKMKPVRDAALAAINMLKESPDEQIIPQISSSQQLLPPQESSKPKVAPKVFHMEEEPSNTPGPTKKPKIEKKREPKPKMAGTASAKVRHDWNFEIIAKSPPRHAYDDDRPLPALRNVGLAESLTGSEAGLGQKMVATPTARQEEIHQQVASPKRRPVPVATVASPMPIEHAIPPPVVHPPPPVVAQPPAVVTRRESNDQREEINALREELHRVRGEAARETDQLRERVLHLEAIVSDLVTELSSLRSVVTRPPPPINQPPLFQYATTTPMHSFGKPVGVYPMVQHSFTTNEQFVNSAYTVQMGLPPPPQITNFPPYMQPPTQHQAFASPVTERLTSHMLALGKDYGSESKVFGSGTRGQQTLERKAMTTSEFRAGPEDKDLGRLRDHPSKEGLLAYLGSAGNHVDKLSPSEILFLVDQLTRMLESHPTDELAIKWLNRIIVELDCVRIPRETSNRIRAAVNDILRSHDELEIGTQLTLQRLAKALSVQTS